MVDFRVMRFLSASMLVILLAGCGGGGTSGGGGNNQFAGVYQGTMVVTVAAGGTSASESAPVVLSVGPDGRLGAAVIGTTSDTTCTQGPPIFLNGNTFTFSGVIKCQGPVLGACTVSFSGNGRINGTVLTLVMDTNFVCTAGTFTARYAITATRTTVQAKGPSTGLLQNIVPIAIGLSGH